MKRHHVLSLIKVLLLVAVFSGCQPQSTEQKIIVEEMIPDETTPAEVAETVAWETEVVETVIGETEIAETTSAETEETQPEGPALPEYSPDDYALLLLEKVNEARMAHGLNALSLDLTVSRLAYVRAQEASLQWSHTRPNGEPCYSVYEEYRISRDFWTGENLANYMLQDAQLIVDSWMESEAHRTNILYPKYNAAGMAVYWSGEKYYIANLFRS